MTDSQNRKRRPRARRNKIWNIALAIFFFILGVIGILIPIMPQFLFFAMSLFFLSLVSPPVRRWMRRFLHRHPKLAHAYKKWRERGRRKRQQLIRKEKELEARVRAGTSGRGKRSAGG